MMPNHALSAEGFTLTFRESLASLKPSSPSHSPEISALSLSLFIWFIRYEKLMPISAALPRPNPAIMWAVPSYSVLVMSVVSPERTPVRVSLESPRSVNRPTANLPAPKVLASEILLRPLTPHQEGRAAAVPAARIMTIISNLILALPSLISCRI